MGKGRVCIVENAALLSCMPQKKEKKKLLKERCLWGKYLNVVVARNLF